ncbi:hypothetical protein ACRQ1B_16230 [Rhizobium panacihumi]|uniref:hypothetical protein n=1 Tax=Rhizobium panacihumi TaxID=2008450 RepID=UPI003D79E83F
MTNNGLSIFGFDLFGLSRPTSNRQQESSKVVEPPQSRADEARREDDDIEPEIFLWGMYPVY